MDEVDVKIESSKMDIDQDMYSWWRHQDRKHGG